MPDLSSMALTTRLDDYFGGASRNDFTMRLTRELLWTSPSGLTFAASSGLIGGSVVNLIMYKTAGTTELPQASFPYPRLISHFLLAELPDAAIDEALQGLTEIWSDFFAPWPTLPEPVPAVKLSGHVRARRQSDPILIGEV